MPFINKLTVAAALLAVSSAAPVAAPKKQEGFRVQRVKNEKFTGHDGKVALAKAAAKYGFTVAGANDNNKVSSSITHEFTSTSSVTATGVGGDVEYLCPVTVGGNQFTLDFDTGSANIWLGGDGTGASPAYEGSNSQINGGSWSISYGDGSGASGDLWSDTVTVGDSSATGVGVGRATQATSSFFQNGGDGLLGLAFSSINTDSPQQLTWFDTAVQQGLPAVFAANLKSGSDAGSYDFGYTDDSAYSGSLTYTNVDNSQGFWMFTPDSGESGIADTGTTLLLLADDTVNNYYANTGATYDNNQGGYTFSCDTQLPDFVVSINGYQATVPGSIINFASVDGNTCFGGIQSRGSNPFSIYGDIFLRSQYTVFDQRNGGPQLGFAAQA